MSADLINGSDYERERCRQDIAEIIDGQKTPEQVSAFFSTYGEPLRDLLQWAGEYEQ